MLKELESILDKYKDIISYSDAPCILYDIRDCTLEEDLFDKNRAMIQIRVNTISISNIDKLENLLENKRAVVIYKSIETGKILNKYDWSEENEYVIRIWTVTDEERLKYIDKVEKKNWKYYFVSYWENEQIQCTVLENVHPFIWKNSSNKPIVSFNEITVYERDMWFGKKK